MDYFLQNEMPYSFNMPIPQKKKKKKSYELFGNFSVFAWHFALRID